MAALAQFVAMAEPEITTLRPSAETRAQLSQMLIDVVADGGSVSFMHPLDPGAADAYWDDALTAAAQESGWCLAPGTAMFLQRR